MTRQALEESLMRPAIRRLAADIDDASRLSKNSRSIHDADADEKLDDLHKTLEHASDMIDRDR